MEEEDEKERLCLKRGLRVRAGKDIYFVQELLGEGTFGAVYRILRHTIVALSVMDEDESVFGCNAKKISFYDPCGKF
ncbi:hypothetical protein COOONC_19659 [Cooperia oncophora]